MVAYNISAYNTYIRFSWELFYRNEVAKNSDHLFISLVC